MLKAPSQVRRHTTLAAAVQEMGALQHITPEVPVVVVVAAVAMAQQTQVAVVVAVL